MFPAFAASLMSLLMVQAAPTSGSDVKIVVRQSFRDHAFTSTEYFSGSRYRQQSDAKVDNIEGHHTARIVLHGDVTNQNFLLDLDAHEYVAFETDQRGIAVGAKSSPAERTPGTVDLWIESTDTGERQDMFGYTARHIITRERRVPGQNSSSVPSESVMDGWYIDYSFLPEWRQPRGQAFHVAGSAGDRIQLHRSGPALGFPIKVVTTFQRIGVDSNVHASTDTREVVELSHAPLDPALFEIPPDFRPVRKLTSMNRPTFTAWDRFKGWLADILR